MGNDLSMVSLVLVFVLGYIVGLTDKEEEL
jgi:hypothetical protein